MKAKIHPKYMKCVVTCACGNTFETRSTIEKMHIEICGKCHPFFTGKQKFMDTAGRVEKFQKRYGLKPKPEETATGTQEAAATETPKAETPKEPKPAKP